MRASHAKRDSLFLVPAGSHPSRVLRDSLGCEFIRKNEPLAGSFTLFPVLVKKDSQLGNDRNSALALRAFRFVHVAPLDGFFNSNFGTVVVLPSKASDFNRYVPLALTILAAIIFSILSFHIFMAPAGLPLAIFVAVLWAVAFINVRQAFSGLLQSRFEPRT